MVPREHSQVSLQFPPRGGVSTFSRCEAPFLHCHKIECRIVPSTPFHRSRGLHPRCKVLCRRRRRALARAFTDTQRRGNPESTADHTQRDNDLHRSAFDAAKSGRCDIGRPLDGITGTGAYPSGGEQAFASASRRPFCGQVRAESKSNRVRNWCAGRSAFAIGLHEARASHSPPEYPAEKSSGSDVESQGYVTVTGYVGPYLQFRNSGMRRTLSQPVQARSPPKGMANNFRVLSFSKVKLSTRQSI